MAQAKPTLLTFSYRNHHSSTTETTIKKLKEAEIYRQFKRVPVTVVKAERKLTKIVNWASLEFRPILVQIFYQMNCETTVKFILVIIIDKNILGKYFSESKHKLRYYAQGFLNRQGCVKNVFCYSSVKCNQT